MEFGGIGAGDSEPKFQRALSRRNSKDRLADLLRQSSRRASNIDNRTREYVMLTGGEDGFIFWWSINVPLVTDLREIAPAEPTQPSKMLTIVRKQDV